MKGPRINLSWAMCVGWPISRVLSPDGAWFTAFAFFPILRQVCDHQSTFSVATKFLQPTRSLMEASNFPPIKSYTPAWPCSQSGLPGRIHCCLRRWSLTPPFHPYLEYQAVYFCGPIRGFPRPEVIRHCALWSADFPQTTRASLAITRPAAQLDHHTPWDNVRQQSNPLTPLL